MNKCSRFIDINKKHFRLYLTYCRNISKKKDMVHSIHQLRVVSRRLANYFWVLKKLIAPADFDVCYKGFRSVIRSLGKARDLDVQLQIFKECCDEYPDHKEDAVKKLHHLLLKKRDGLTADVQETIKFSLQRRFPKRVKSTMTQLNKKLKTLGTDGIKDFSTKRIIKRIHALLGFEQYVKRPQASKELHELRIEAKKLRFTLETLQPCFSRKYKILTELAVEIQKLLGLFHDLEEWMAFLQDALKKTRNIELQQLIRRFIRHSKIEKMKCYRQFVKTWESAKRKRIFDRAL